MRISQKITLVGIAAATTVLLGAVGCASAPHAAAPLAQVATTTPAASATPSATPTPAPLTGTASVTRRHPIAGTKAGISVVTVPGARINVVAYFESGEHRKTARADATGLHTFWFTLGSAPPGYRVKVDVRVSANGQKRTYRASFTPRQRPPPPMPAPAPIHRRVTIHRMAILVGRCRAGMERLRKIHALTTAFGHSFRLSVRGFASVAPGKRQRHASPRWSPAVQPNSAENLRPWNREA